MTEAVHGSSFGRAARAFTWSTKGFGRTWIMLAEIDLLYKAIAFAALTPLIGLCFRLLIARTGSDAVADVDIAMFFVTTRAGVVALVLISALVIAVSALQQACLMTVGLSAERGAALRVRDAFGFVATRAFAVLRMTIQFVIRLIVLVLPFLAGIGATYALLLRAHDINYYLTDRPPEFLAAVAIAGVLLALLAVLLVRMISGWMLVLPIIVFEGMLPVFAFGESKRRMMGRRAAAVLALAAWALIALALPLVASAGLRAFGRAMAPLFGGTMAGMMLFIGFVLVLYLIVTLAIGVVVGALFALIVVRFYLDAGPGAALKLPEPFADVLEIEGRRFLVSWKAIVITLVVGVPGTALAAHVLMKATWTDREVLVIAHRGASAEAPENTLAAFRLATEQQADIVELDVQESQDGVVVVAHDKDLMKIGRSPLKVFETPAALLRDVDIGSHFSPQFSSERLPTLAEALAVCKSLSRVDIELKDYGHDVKLEERVIELVEAAGMEDQIVTMSLSKSMVEKMESLRPSWTSGLLIAKAIGQVSHLKADFLAVESSMATRSFIKEAHAAGKPVYVWTVNDPQRMIRLIGLGVDGLITDRPALAKAVVAQYAGTPPTGRLLMFVMTRLGAHEEISEPENDLRP
jgi:glycerophosphoryl diester phosphodiesterase